MPSSDPLVCTTCARQKRNCEFTVERSTKRRKTKDALEAGDNRHDGSTADYDSAVVRTVVSSSNDALGLLFKAAEQPDDSDDSGDPIQPPGRRDSSRYAPNATPTSTLLPSTLSRPSKETMGLWKQHLFVRQGWFSAVEAITYVDLFFLNLSGLSPISITLSEARGNYRDLMLDEPLLCCTILMVSSRYHVLPGPGGLSRANFIHMRLWKHCEHLIGRITLGQEKFSTAKLRTLGSMKALLLMTEWHPRALHFPPEYDGWNASLLPDGADQAEVDKPNSQLHRWREEIFEPAKRSERMSWMMLGLATSLAHELGVFTESDFLDKEHNLDSETCTRTQRVLFLYANQLSLRIGCTSSLPETLMLSFTSPTNIHDLATRDRDAFISQAIEITKLRKTTSELFFPSKSATRQIMTSGKYITLLDHFQPLVAQWYQKFDQTQFTSKYTAASLLLLMDLALPRSSRQMLFIDYSYVRMYINSIAIQAVVERAKTKGAMTILDQEFAKKENRREYQFIQEVVEASRSILATAVDLATADLLRYCPVRVFISVTSASIFLLKAVSLGTRQSELDKSLDTLERCIHALRYKTYDDMHLSSRYGMLLERHVKNFKRSFRGSKTPSKAPRNPAGADFSLSQQIGNFSGRGNEQGLLSDEDVSFDSPQFGDDVGPEIDDWLAQPFDPAFAPFDFDISQAASGLEMSSLDFLWNLPT